MPKVLVSDIIVPTIFEQYSIQRTAQLSALFSSGIISNDPDFDERASSGGNVVNMPFFNDLTGARQLLSDAQNLSVNGITTGQDAARIQNTANAWSVNLLATLLSGADPMAAIGDLVGGYWARTLQAMLIASLNGVFGAASMSGNVLTIASETIAGQSADTKLNASTFIDALGKLGDRSSRLVAVAMHSDTKNALKKLDLIETIKGSDGEADLETFQGRMIIEDDTMPKRAGTTNGNVYTTYLFGMGAIANGNGSLSAMPLMGGFGTEAVEFARVPLASDNVMINRKRMILHPRGVKFTSVAVAADSPTDAELATQTNWVRVYENKNVRMVAIVHNN